LTEYIDHPYPKRLDTDGNVCRRATTGLLLPRHIDAFHVEQIGKDASRLEEVEAGLVHDKDEVYSVYEHPRRDPWPRLYLPVLNDIPRQELDAGGLSESALREVLAGRARPRAETRVRLSRLAVRFASKQLEGRGAAVPRHRLAVLYAYLQERRTALKLCPGCGANVPAPRATYCGPASKQRAYRQRH
jgi:hypothetical protein